MAPLESAQFETYSNFWITLVNALWKYRAIRAKLVFSSSVILIKNGTEQNHIITTFFPRQSSKILFFEIFLKIMLYGISRFYSCSGAPIRQICCLLSPLRIIMNLLNFQLFIKLVTIIRFKSNIRRFVRWRVPNKMPTS